MIGFYQFLSGIVMMGCVVSGLFFLRFWNKTRDRIFLVFACALFTLSVERVFLALLEDQTREEHSLVYVVRLIAFLLILVGVLDKNFSEKRHNS